MVLLLKLFAFLIVCSVITLICEISKSRNIAAPITKVGISECAPNVIHFIKIDGGQKEFTFLHFMAFFSAQMNGNFDAIVLHCDVEPTGQWWDLTKMIGPAPIHIDIGMNDCASDTTSNGKRVVKYQHKSDFARICLLDHFGGVYSDLDSIVMRPFGPKLLCGADYVAGIESDEGRNVAVGVIIATPNNQYLKYFGEISQKVFNGKWSTHSVMLNRKLVGNDPRSLVLGAVNFYPHFENRSYFLGNVPLPLEDTEEYFENSGNFVTRESSYAIHVYNSFCLMKEITDKLTSHCETLKWVRVGLNSGDVLAPIQWVVAENVCKVLDEGLLDMNECLDDYAFVCKNVFSDFK